MASVVAMSPYHFSRLFKESIGKTPMQFVQEHRIDEAKVLLKNLNLPIIDIANRCGFSDQSHFSKVFKKVSGMSPKSFRKSI
ncbi:MAG: helix-turn-helix transcriptional regulator [Bdellovibrionales bacterium]|nr:helix-turn-helix transcriptional regulator [Bdellovibrionales bacterium]